MCVWDWERQRRETEEGVGEKEVGTSSLKTEWWEGEAQVVMSKCVASPYVVYSVHHRERDKVRVCVNDGL